MDKKHEHLIVSGLIALIVSVLVCFTIPAGKRVYRAKQEEGKEVKTVKIVDPITKKVYSYPMTEIVEQRDGYIAFKTSDGRLVEVVDNKITEN